MDQHPEEHILAFLHDMADTPLTWQDQVGSLPEGWRPLTPWLRGMKPTDSDAFDLQAAADALSTIPLEHGVERFALCGDGLGAAVALRAAADSPEVVSGVILSRPLVAPPAGSIKMQKASLKMTPRSRLAAQNLDKDRLMATLDMLATLDIGQAPEDIHCPVLLLLPEGLPRAAAEQMDQFAERLRVSSTVTIPGGVPSHRANPEAFNEAVRTFLGLLDGERLA